MYYKALEDPENLADFDLPSGEMECQILYQVAETAYEERTGTEFQRRIRMPWELTMEGVEPAGDRLTEDQAQERFPRLIALAMSWE